MAYSCSNCTVAFLVRFEPWPAAAAAARGCRRRSMAWGRPLGRAVSKSGSASVARRRHGGRNPGVPITTSPVTAIPGRS